MTSRPGSSPPSTVTEPPPREGESAEDAPARPDRIGDRYQVLREIATGGMGEVVAARDQQFQREVAIKRTRKRFASERAVARFLREARIQGRLEHPAIVPVHEIGRDAEGSPYFVMKKLAGTTLAEIVDGGGEVPVQRLLRALADVCLAVEFAHVRGVLHRDLKPDNIMLGEFGEVFVLDWGVAKVIGENDVALGEADDDQPPFVTAGGGGAIGTPGYMAPEQARSEPDLDGRSDVYALGCILFEILAGEPLHPEERPVSIERDARPSRRVPGREIPPELDELCVEATAYERERRLGSARILGERLHRYLDGDRDVAKRRELALEHLELARRAYKGDSDAERRDAMREAARALALDPALGDAAALVGRLMLEPPRTTPREVEVAIHQDDVRMMKANARGGLWMVVTALAFMPLFWWITRSGSPYYPLFIGALVLDLVLVAIVVRAPAPRPGLAVIGNALILVVLARMFSPLLIAPGLAAVLGMALVLWPRFSPLGSAIAIAALNMLAVVGPWALEWLGWAPSTMSVDAKGILLRAPVVADSELPTTIVAVVYTCALIGSACTIAAAMRARHRAAHRALHMQAWQLRQLVPADAPP